jgi:hypothetical protein
MGSWGKHYNSIKDFRDRKPSSDTSTPADKEQVEVAEAAVKSIIDSGAIGKGKKKEFRIHMGGHSNPKHEPQPGSPYDSVGISIEQVVDES